MKLHCLNFSFADDPVMCSISFLLWAMRLSHLKLIEIEETDLNVLMQLSVHGRVVLNTVEF